MKKIWIVFGLGVILRLILSAMTFHADIRAFDLGGQLVAGGNLLNLYDYLAKLSPRDPLVSSYTSTLLIYPPAIYFLHGLFSLIFGNFFSSTYKTNFLLNLPQVLGNPATNFHLLALKLPYLVFDLPAGFLLMKLFETPRQKYLSFVCWMFNPITLFATYMMGQFDIIPTFFVISAMVIVSRNRRWLKLDSLSVAALLLGVGAAFKLYPLFLLVPLCCLSNSLKTRIKILILGVLPYTLPVLIYLPSKGFRSSALVAGQTLKSLYAQIWISGGESIILYLLSMGFFYLLFWYGRTSAKEIWQRFFIPILLFFIFTHYHPQWFVWITPFLIIDLVESDFKHSLLVSISLISFFGLLTFFDSGLTIGLFAPIAPALYNSPTIWELLHRVMDYNFWRSLLQTLFVSSALFYLYLYFPRKEKA